MDAVVVDAEEVEAHNGVFRGLSEPLGVSGFRINRLELPARGEAPEHDHSSNGQEEVYAVVGGSGVLRLSDREISVRPGHFIFCPPEVQRQLVAGDDGLVWIAVGSAVPRESAG